MVKKKHHSNSEKGNPPPLLHGHPFRLAARVLLYVQSHRQDSTFHGLYYTSRGSLGGTGNCSVGGDKKIIYYFTATIHT